jgi:hypothetical protein
MAADEQAVGCATGEVHELQGLQLVGGLATVKAMGQDHGADLEATLLVLAIRGPMPVLGLRSEGLRTDEVGHVTQGLGDATGVLGFQIIVVVPHDGVEMDTWGEHLTQGCEEGGSVPVLVKKGVFVLVRVDGGG